MIVIVFIYLGFVFGFIFSIFPNTFSRLFFVFVLRTGCIFLGCFDDRVIFNIFLITQNNVSFDQIINEG